MDTRVAEVELENVSKTFPGTRALRGVLVYLLRGEVHALVGENGSGKSTLIKILAGFHHPDPGGVIRMAGERIESDRATAAHRLGLRFVHQGLGLINELTAVENIALSAGYLKNRARAIDWAGEERRVRTLLSRFAVDIDLAAPVAELDAVERTAVAIVRALIDADATRGALVLDEPTVALSPPEVERLFAIVREVSRTGMSVLYVSHYLEEVFQIAATVSVLREGRLVATRPTSELTRRDVVQLMVGQDIDLSLETHRQHSDATATAPTLTVRALAGRELRGIDLDVHPGEIVGIAGLQGSGIGELAYAILGATRCAGDVTVKGRHIRRRTPLAMREHGVLLVPRDRQREGAVLPFLVRENLTLGHLRELRQHGLLNRSKERTSVATWITNLEINPPDGERPYTTLSGGNQQKVVLGKWLSLNPQVLLLDEPTNGVDVGARIKIYTTVLDMAARGLAVIVCSSDAAELAELASRVLVLSRGQIVRELTGEHVTEKNILHELAGVAA